MGNHPEFAEVDVALHSVLRDAGLVAKVVYDIGAANAFWSTRVSDKVHPGAAFHLFEPLAETQASYAGYLKKNLSEHPGFTLHPVALGDRDGTVEFWTDPDGYSSTALAMKGVTGFSPKSVKMVRLDDYVERLRLPPPDVIKIDVQGFEEQILRNGVRCMQHATALQIETWFYRGYGPKTPLLSEIIDLVGEHGFDLVELGDRYYAGGHTLTSVDAYFVKREWAKARADRLPAGDWVYGL
jgi:FkbM family methyltransferase